MIINNETLHQLEEFPNLFIGGGNKGHFVVYNYTSEALLECYNVDCIGAIVTMIKHLNGNYPISDFKSLEETCKHIWESSNYSFPKCYNCNSNSCSKKEYCYYSIGKGDLQVSNWYTPSELINWGCQFEFVVWEQNKEYYIGSFTFELIGNDLFIKGIDEYALHYHLPCEFYADDILTALKDFCRNHTFEELDLSHPRNFKYQHKLRNWDKMAYPTEFLTLNEVQLIIVGLRGISKMDKFGFRSFGYPFDVKEYGIGDWYKKCISYKQLFKPVKQEMVEIVSEIPLIKPVSNEKSNRDSDEYASWRKSVLKRDGSKCVVCGDTEHLHSHHLFGYQENENLRLNVNNGVTLCKHCHRRYHQHYGNKNINPVDFMNFIKRFGVKV